jgi:hypothetical protein
MPTRSYGVIHAIIECEDCGWGENSSYKNAQAIAKIHAKRYGHKVRGELGIGFNYDFRDSPPTPKKDQVKP